MSKKLHKFQNIKIFENLNWQQLELIEANKNHLSGLHLQEDYQRIYPSNNYFCHTIGYINQPSQKDLNLPYISKMPQLDIGKSGLEQYLNEVLIGKAGKREIEVNSLGRIIREISKDKSLKGKNVTVSIDHRVQKICHKELSQHKAGSVVVINIQTGEVISKASVPTFNPNLIVKKPNNKYWQSILDNSLSPLTDRSVQGLYSPGSTFKMIVALAGLKLNIIQPEQVKFCSGKIEFGDRFYHCWKTNGHGTMNLENAIKESCDVYFYQLAKNIGIDNIAKIAFEFGFGKRHLTSFVNEKSGIVPSKKWKKQQLNESWYAGETLLTGIGQGYALATPLQLALMTARIASNGKKIEPTIFKVDEKKEFSQLSNNLNHFNIIKNAMFKTVNEKRGTAHSSKSNNYYFSGKTGTSQVKRITKSERESEDFRKKDIEWKNKDHALFVGYMPSDKPKYAISVVIEHGGSGASTAAPIAKNIFDFIYKLDI